MSHLRPIDLAIFVGTIGVWSLCFVLHLSQMASGGTAWMPVQVTPAEGPDDYPVIRYLWPSVESRLEIGDALTRVGDFGLEGAGRVEYASAVYTSAAAPSFATRVGFRRDGVDAEADLRLVPISLRWRPALVSLAFVVIGAVTFWTARGMAPTRTFFLAGSAYALHWVYFWGGSMPQLAAGVMAFGIGPALAFPLTIRTIQSFPREVATDSIGARTWPWVLSIVGFGVVSWGFGMPISGRVGLWITVATTLAMITASLALLTRNYSRASTGGRRAIKWVAFGFYVGLVPPLIAGMATLVDPGLWWLYEVSLLSVLAIPPCLFIALVRDHLFDINRLISVATTYTLLSVVFFSGVLFFVPVAARAASQWIDADVSQVALSVLAAVIVLAPRARLVPWFESNLFPEREKLVGRAQALRAALSTCSQPSDVFEMLGDRLDELLHPDCIAIYGAAGNAFAPLYERGPAVAPVVSGSSEVVVQLRSQMLPIRRRELGRSAEANTEVDDAVLDSMAVELILPVYLADELAAFVCLGAKRTGDPYSSRDLSLLGSVTDKASDQLGHFRREDVYRQERAMYEELRQYVPGAIAERVQEGSSLEPREAEVSILFVDLRGYMSFSESRSADTIFSAINAYTNLVSRIVREHGGSVVEFNGDGMMVIFGAPEELEKKEGAAIACARAISENIRGMEFDHDTRLDVGVGIATGGAFVGSVQAVDRKIWSALGNTTNLAARLQRLTREVNASIVVDAPTWLGADKPKDFQRLGPTPIRGRRFPIDTFALPLSPTTPLRLEETK